jgi:transcriptional regulator with GAF, ATPase, and Fis domain
LFDRAQAEDIRHRQTERRALSAALTRKIAGETGSAALPGHVLHGVVELAGCTRGFLLLANGDDFSVSASLSLEPDALAGRAFSGSVGAVQRVLADGKAVVVNDIGSEAWLAERASVIASDLQTLVCLPLLDRATVFGAVYADRRGTADGRPHEPITDFDLELLTAFAESATLYLLAQRAMHLLDARRPDAAPRWNAIVEMHAGIAANLHGGVQ